MLYTKPQLATSLAGTWWSSLKVNLQAIVLCVFPSLTRQQAFPGHKNEDSFCTSEGPPIYTAEPPCSTPCTDGWFAKGLQISWNAKTRSAEHSIHCTPESCYCSEAFRLTGDPQWTANGNRVNSRASWHKFMAINAQTYTGLCLLTSSGVCLSIYRHEQITTYAYVCTWSFRDVIAASVRDISTIRPTKTSFYKNRTHLTLGTPKVV